MTVNDGMQLRTTAPTPGSQVPRRHEHRPRNRTYTLVAVVLVATVITASSLASSGISKSLATAQHHYLNDVTPVEEADVVFNGGGSTPPDHSATSTQTLVRALGEESRELDAQSWPKSAAMNIAELENFTRSEEGLLQSFETAPPARRAVILNEQSMVLNKIESKDLAILKELKLPLPTTASVPVSPATPVP